MGKGGVSTVAMSVQGHKMPQTEPRHGRGRCMSILDGARRGSKMYEGIGLLVIELTRSTLKFTQRNLGERILVEKEWEGVCTFPLLWEPVRGSIRANGGTRRIITRPPFSGPSIPFTFVLSSTKVLSLSYHQKHSLFTLICIFFYPTKHNHRAIWRASTVHYFMKPGSMA